MHDAMGYGYMQALITMFQRLLDEVDKDVTRVQDKLANGMKRVAWVIKRNEGTLEIREKYAESLLTSAHMNIDTASSCCIALLILVLIILLVLLLLV